jgi:Flp pilus assembly pilin Flp
MSPSSDSGQTTAEYAVVIGMITLGVVLAVSGLSGAILDIFASLRSALG